MKGKFDALKDKEEESMTTAKMEIILAREMAYLYLNADYWFYIMNDKSCYNMNVDAAVELKHVIIALGLNLKGIIKTAKEIYDWVRADGRDVDLTEIKEKHRNFCDPITKKRKLILK